MIKMEQKQVLSYGDTKKILKPIVLEKGKCLTVNECNAAEKIKDYPEAIQKLVWRALHYKCEINALQSMSLRTSKDYEKLTKYIETFRHTQQLICKMCKRQNPRCLRWIIIEDRF